MSKQSDAKENQGYTKDVPCCQNCESFSLKKEEVKSKYSSHVYIK